METVECIAMIFADERAPGLGALAKGISKPAVFFGGNNRIIDFALSNCGNSGIKTVGVITNGVNDGLHAYIGDGRAWGLTGQGGGVHMLSLEKDGNTRYGMDALCWNIDFMERFSPRYVCVLSGARIYNMDYRKMLDYHKEKNADATVAYVEVNSSKNCCCGALYPDETGLVVDYKENPAGQFNFASIGACIFNYDVLLKLLKPGLTCKRSVKCFGVDILPAVLASGCYKLYGYRFDGYWRNVDTLENLWKVNMELLDAGPGFAVQERGSKIYTSSAALSSCCSQKERDVKRSIVYGSHVILGSVEGSILSDSIFIGEGAQVVDSVLMPNVYVGSNAKIYKTIVAPRSHIMDGAEIGVDYGADDFVSDEFCSDGVSLVAPWTCVTEEIKLQKNSYILK